MAKHAFEKFINKPVSGAKKKEAIRQEKRKLKQEKREKIQDARYKKQDAKFKEQSKYKVPGTKYEMGNPKPERFSRPGKLEIRNPKSIKHTSRTTSYSQSPADNQLETE